MSGLEAPGRSIPAQFRLNFRLRMGGFIPLGFFLLRLVDYVKWGTPAHIWWNCHVANLSLGLGMLFGNRMLMRLAALWLLLGLPPWALDMWETHIIWPSSLLTHLGGALLALVVLGQVRMVRGVWPLALVWFLVLQLLSHWFTSPEMNVNVAHAVYPTARPWFSHYWMFWLVLTMVIALLLWLLEQGLVWLFPLNRQPKTNACFEKKQAGQS